MHPVLNATHRVGAAVKILQALKEDIEREWPSYPDRPDVAIELETTLELALVDLAQAHLNEAPDLDKAVSRLAIPAPATPSLGV